MKKTTTILAAFFLALSTVFAQNKNFFIGPVVSFQQENRTLSVFNRADESSANAFFGAGVRLQKRISNTWGLNTGFNYVTRSYDMVLNFDFCHFADYCPEIYSFTKRFGYKTIEVPLSLNKYIISNQKWELYLHAGLLGAVDFQSFYDDGFHHFKNKGWNLFSASATGGVGAGYRLSPKISVNLGTFVRLAHTQRPDVYLWEGAGKKWTYFDNFGGNLMVLFQI
jgi:hypothetical protein